MSVLEQTYGNFELLIIDDGSIDSSRKIILNISDHRIKYMYQVNHGVSAARNLGLLHARGRWIAFLDSDDVWDRSYLSSVVNKIIRFPTLQIIFTNALKLGFKEAPFELFEEKRIVNKEHKEFDIITKPTEFFIEHRLNELPCLVIEKKAFIDLVKFDESMSIAEDVNFILNVSILVSFMGVQYNPLVKIIRHDDDAGHLSKQAVSDGIYTFKCLEKTYENLMTCELPISTTIKISKELSTHRRAIGNLFLKQGEKEIAKAYYKLSHKGHPSLKSMAKIIISTLPLSIQKALIFKGKNITP